MKKKYLLIMLSLLSWVAFAHKTSPTAVTIVYVTQMGSGLNNGTAWNQAYSQWQLQAAIDFAAAHAPAEVWVGQGTYYPTTDLNNMAAFSLRNGVTVYGGFPFNGGTMAERNPTTHPTILSGNIGDLNNQEDNSRRVVFNEGVDNTARLDGFTITLGGASTTFDIGGGMVNAAASPTIINCRFVSNQANQGGAMHNVSNQNGNSHPTIINCYFASNYAVSDGGAVYNNAQQGICAPSFINCVFYSNQAGFGGAMSNFAANGSSNPVITNCTFASNNYQAIATNTSLLSSNPVLTNCILWGNGGTFAIHTGFNATTTINYSILETGVSGYTGTNNLIGQNPQFKAALMGDLTLLPCSPAINAGLTSANATDQDLAGQNRVLENAIDMGAYEVAQIMTPTVATQNGQQTVTVPVNTSLSLYVTNCTGSGFTWENSAGGSGAGNSGIIAVNTTTPGTFVYTVVCYHGPNCTSPPASATVVVQGGSNMNQPPVAPAIQPQIVTRGIYFSLPLPVFTDPDNDPLTYDLHILSMPNALPDGVSFNPATRTLSGTPTNTGSYNLAYKATDAQNQTTQTTFLISIVNAPDPGGQFEGYLDKVECGTMRGWVWDKDHPFAPITLEFFADGQSIGTTVANMFRQDLKDAGKGNGNHAYSFPTPESLKDGQNHSISAKVINSNYTLKWAPKMLNCPASGSNGAPVAPGIAPINATKDTYFSSTLTAFTDPQNGPLTYALTGSLPNGVSFDSGTRTLSGTPTQTGTFPLTYSATDNQNLTSQTAVTLTVSDGNPPVGSGKFEGFLDKVECGSFRGWAWDASQPNTPVSVEFFADGQSLGTTPADIFRQDIKDAGKGNGYHVYFLPTPQTLKDGQPHLISAKVAGSNYTLKWAPKTLTCPSGSRLATESAENRQPWTLTVLGNPVTGSVVEVDIQQAQGQLLRLQLVDLTGKPVADQWLEVTQAQQPTRLEFGPNQQAGLYLLRVAGPSQTKTVKILKR